MSDARTKPSDAQLELFSGSIDWETVDSLSPDLQVLARRHSAAYLERDNPRLVQAIIELMKLGTPDQRIARACNVSPNLIAEIRAKAFDKLSVEDTMRARLYQARRLGQAILNRLTQEVESGKDIPARDLALIYKVIDEARQQAEQQSPDKPRSTTTDEEAAFRARLLELGTGFAPEKMPGTNDGEHDDLEPLVIDADDPPEHTECPAT